MAESASSGPAPRASRYEYLWFNGEPAAQVEPATGTVSYYFNDHLGAPILQTDSTGTVVWRVEREPYGERYATRVGSERHQPLGLPGQEYDASSDRQYNIFRWYRASWGRYTQADPAQRMKQLWPYAYGLDRPTSVIDPWGLEATTAELFWQGCKVAATAGASTVATAVGGFIVLGLLTPTETGRDAELPQAGSCSSCKTEREKCLALCEGTYHMALRQCIFDNIDRPIMQDKCFKLKKAQYEACKENCKKKHGGT
jgi:RHS repeat-associated protein